MDSDDSSNELGYRRAFNGAMVTVYGLVSVVATMANSALIYAACSVRRSAQTPLLPLLVNLAVCDLFISVLVVPLTALMFVRYRWQLGGALCPVVNFVSVTATYASVFTLVAISLQHGFGLSAAAASRGPAAEDDRNGCGGGDCGRVGRRGRAGGGESHLAGCRRRWCSLTGCLIVVWSLACACGLPNAVNYTLEPCPAGPLPSPPNSTASCSLCVENWNRTLLLLGVEPGNRNESAARLYYTLTVLALLFALPAAVIAAAHCRIYRLLAASLRQRRSHVRLLNLSTPDSAAAAGAVNSSSTVRVKRAKRIYRLSIVLVAVFVLFWAPFHVWNLFVDAFLHSPIGDLFNAHYHLVKDLYVLFMCLALSNSVANPVFLFCTHSAYRLALRKLLRPCGGSALAAAAVSGTPATNDQPEAADSNDLRGDFGSSGQQETLGLTGVPA